jgi:hypothetical protein
MGYYQMTNDSASRTPARKMATVGQLFTQVTHLVILNLCRA